MSPWQWAVYLTYLRWQTFVPFSRMVILIPRADATHTVAETPGQTMDTLALPTVKSRLVYHTIAYLAASQWNSLPSHCRVAESSTNFIHSIKLFLGFPVIS